jgi:RNA polymerase sigma-70 factor (ECF subfamily)
MDKDSLIRLRAGDPEAFRELVETFRDKVGGTCFRFLRSREDAEETALDVFWEVHRSLPAFREESELSTWIFRIAVTKSLDRLRKSKRRKRSPGAEGALPVVPWEAVPDPSETGPGEILERAERARVLQDAIDGLPESQKAAFTLSKMEGLDNGRIAAILETTVPAVDALLIRAKRNLRKTLSRYYRNLISGES